MSDSFIRTKIRELLVGRRPARGAIQLILFNIVVTGLVIFFVLYFGDPIAKIDYLDLTIESAKPLVQFFMFSLISFVQLKKSIKNQLLLGLLCMQQGMLLDMLDEIVYFNSYAWHLWGDVIFLLASILTAIGATNWVVLNYKLASMDKLTNVYNRRHFETILEQFLYRLRRLPQVACLMTVDLDDFKEINDKLGHSVGDDVLRLVGEVLIKCSRKSDVICRSGGEEFEILLCDCDLYNAVLVGKRILEELGNSKPEPVQKLSASIGITLIRDSDTISSVRIRADDAMYNAKRNGKSQVVMHEELT